MIATKKSKEQKRSDIDKVKEYKDKYESIYFIENTDIPSNDIQNLRKAVDGKIIFVKKSIFQKIFPSCNFSENYFLIFTNDKQPIEEFKYVDYAVKGNIAPQDVIVNKGVVKKEKLLPYLKNTVIEGSNRVLVEDFMVCKENDVLNEDQAAILKILGYKFGSSKLNILDGRSTSEIK